MSFWKSFFGPAPASMPVDTVIQRQEKAARLAAVYRPFVGFVKLMYWLKLLSAEDAAELVERCVDEVEDLMNPNLLPKDYGLPRDIKARIRHINPDTEILDDLSDQLDTW